MPIGCCSLVPEIATRLARSRPRSALDLGIGMGFYGAVVRQWLDPGVRPWQTKLVRIEDFAGNRNRMLLGVATSRMDIPPVHAGIAGW